MKAVEFQGVQRLSPFQGWCVKMSRNTLKMPRNDGKFARVVARVKSAGPGPGWKSAAFPAKFTGREHRLHVDGGGACEPGGGGAPGLVSEYLHDGVGYVSGRLRGDGGELWAGGGGVYMTYVRRV